MEFFICSINNPLAIMMIIIMFILLLVIALLANVLLGTAGFYKDKAVKEEAEEKQRASAPVSATVMIGLVLTSFSAMAQDAAVTTTVGGLPKSVFYLMTGVIFLEITVILVMLANVRILIAKERKRKAAAQKARPAFNWWNKLNKFRPVHEEAAIELGHSYDGIRELDNRLPPWWLYGFYITIIFSGIYMWRYHVSHTAPSSEEEFQIAMVKAEEQKEAYLKKAAANVDENTVKLLTEAADIQSGQNVFQSSCAACHGKAGEGMVGPNLTDDYWLHGGSVKDIFKTIKYGVPEKGMKSWKEDFSPKQLAQLSSYIKSLHGSHPANAKEKQGELYTEESVKDSTVKVIAAASEH